MLNLPPHVHESVGDRASAIYDRLADWLDENVGPDDARAAGAALLQLATELQTEATGDYRRACSNLSAILEFMRFHGRDA